MDFNTLQTKDWIEQLKCTFCKNYLSHFPIYISSNNDNICSRCECADMGIELIRNQAYEIVAQELQFPCRYQNEGCWEKLRPERIPQHETGCSYRTIECPTQNFTNCNIAVSYPNMMKHCRQKHSDLFLKNYKFDIDVSISQELYNLLEHREQLFIVSRKYFLKENIFAFSLVHRKNQGAWSVVSPCELNFTCGNKELTIKYSVNWKTYINEISLESLLKSTEKGSKIVVEIYIGTKSALNSDVETINKELLNLFKCSRCGEYNLPQTNNRSSNNTRCSSCQNQLYSNVSTVYYSAMDKVANMVKFPCQNANKGCSFTSSVKEMTNHRELCQYGAQICPTKDYTNCTWNGSYKDLDSHFRTKHHTLLITSNTISENIMNLRQGYNNNAGRAYTYYDHDYFQFAKCYILTFGSYFFNLIFFLRDQKYYWVMQMLGEFKDIFKYEIEMIDNNKNINKMIVTQVCSKQCKKQELLNNLHQCCCFPSEQIQNFLRNQSELTFKVHISKIN